MLSNMPTSNSLASAPPFVDSNDVALDDMDDHADNRSSSLSELGTASDMHSVATPRPLTATNSVDNDSEAETERLEHTPRKLTRTATDASITTEILYERTPSKLVHSTTVETVDEDVSAPASPTPALLRAVDTSSGNAALDTLSFLAASEANSLELAGKKRKRSSADMEPVTESTDEPARKRSSTDKQMAPNGIDEEMTDIPEQMDEEQRLDKSEERIAELAQEGAELEQRQADVATETIHEMATVAKLTKPRKGRGRGKRKLEDNAATPEGGTPTEAQGEGDGDQEEEDSATLDEQGKFPSSHFSYRLTVALAAKKKTAIDELAKIEKKFKIFREK